MSEASGKRSSRKTALMLGLGLDNEDKHVRVTRGRNFCLLGGSEQTHEDMQRTAMRVNEKLKKKGKSLEDVGRNEFHDLVRESAEE
jgi:hypothetical protein